MPARDPWFIMDGAAALVDAEEARLGAAGIFTPGDTGVLARSGVLPSGVTPLRVHQTPTASGSLLVEAGQGVIQGTTSATQGTYTATVDSQLTLAYLATYPADAQPRKDIVVARINDKAYAGSTAEFKIDIIKGTASGSPVDPTLPASCIALARINLPASATTVADAVIDDLRSWTVPRGGVLPCLSSARPTVPYTGQHIYETNTGLEQVWDGSAWKPFAFVGGAWASYTPTLTGFTLGNGTMTTRWTSDGKTAHVAFQIAFGSTSTWTSTFGLSLPTAARDLLIAHVGHGFALDSSASVRRGLAIELATTTTINLFEVTAGASVSNTSPWTWANGDGLRGLLTYEVA
jgi:hypothetical protein